MNNFKKRLKGWKGTREKGQQSTRTKTRK